MLTEIILTLLSSEAVEARGVVLGWRLLTDPFSPIYAPQVRSVDLDRLLTEALAVLFALRRVADQDWGQACRQGMDVARPQIATATSPATPPCARSAAKVGSPKAYGPVRERAEVGASVSEVRTDTRPAKKRSLHEASHKLGYFAPPAPSAAEERSAAVRRRFEALADSERDVLADAGRAVLALGALGVVYGDIGTSPLYTEQVIFTAHRAAAHTTPAGVYGVVSLIFWALMIVVSIKYAGFIMRAHNRGDGGIMALAALLQRNKVAYASGAGDARHLRRGAVLR